MTKSAVGTSEEGEELSITMKLASELNRLPSAHFRDSVGERFQNGRKRRHFRTLSKFESKTRALRTTEYIRRSKFNADLLDMDILHILS